MCSDAVADAVSGGSARAGAANAAAPMLMAASVAAAIAADARHLPWATGRISALVDRLIVSLFGARIELAGASDSHVRIGDHLLPVRHPAGGARDGEQHGEHRARYPQRAVDDAGVEIDIGIE